MDRKQAEELESSLSQDLARGDHSSAAARIVEGYGDELFGYLVRTTRDEVDASEIFSQFCENLCRSLPKFEGRSSFRTWVYRVLTATRARHYVDPYKRRGVRLATDEMAQIEERVRSRTLQFLRTEVRDGFALIRERLEPEENALLILRVDRNMSWSEIAEVLSEPEDVVRPEPVEVRPDELATRAAAWRQRFKRLKDKIRKLAREQGLMESE